jgi:hypothetical protein
METLTEVSQPTTSESDIVDNAEKIEGTQPIDHKKKRKASNKPRSNVRVQKLQKLHTKLKRKHHYHEQLDERIRACLNKIQAMDVAETPQQRREERKAMLTFAKTTSKLTQSRSALQQELIDFLLEELENLEKLQQKS